MPSLQGGLTKPEEMRDVHMEKAINALMLQGGRERKAAGEGERTSGEGRVKIQIKCIRILPPPPKRFPIPKNRSKKEKAPQTKDTEVGITERKCKRNFRGRRCKG